MTTVINSPRIGGYDLARALAVFGMPPVNFDALQIKSEKIRSGYGLPSTVESEHLLCWITIDPRTPLPLFILSGAGTSALAVSPCIWASERAKDRWLHRSFLATGPMSLTVCESFVLFGFGLAHLLIADRSSPSSHGCGAIFFMSSLILCSC